MLRCNSIAPTTVTLMEFGLFSNGFRPHASAAQSYDEDIGEIVLADELGFRDAYVSEHHGELPYINAVDTIPAPEMLMCKAAALTKRIRMGAAVKLIHLHHPVDVAIQAAVTSHLLGPGRFIFGFGTGFSAPLFSLERGLSFEDRAERMVESLEMIQQCWANIEPFDLKGRFWKGDGVIALPKPIDGANTAMATATASDVGLRVAAERGFTVMSAFLEPASMIRAKGQKLAGYAKAAGISAPLKNLTVARLIYIADSRKEAIEDMRDAVTYEVSVQAKRGFLNMLKSHFDLDVPNDSRALDVLVEAGLYMVGNPDEVTRQIRAFYDESGGFGTLLLVGGKAWATREKRHRSMRRFMAEVAPHLKGLNPDGAELLQVA